MKHRAWYGTDNGRRRGHDVHGRVTAMKCDAPQGRWLWRAYGGRSWVGMTPIDATDADTLYDDRLRRGCRKGGPMTAGKRLARSAAVLEGGAV